jgi:hypothetical protein
VQYFAQELWIAFRNWLARQQAGLPECGENAAALESPLSLQAKNVAAIPQRLIKQIWSIHFRALLQGLGKVLSVVNQKHRRNLCSTETHCKSFIPEAVCC